MKHVVYQDYLGLRFMSTLSEQTHIAQDADISLRRLFTQSEAEMFIVNMRKLGFKQRFKIIDAG